MTIEERLEKVEKELTEAKRRNRWLLTVLGLVIVGLGMVWLLAKTTSSATAATTPKVVRANAFIVVDTNGKERAKLDVTKGGQTELVLFDENGEQRALLAVNKDGPGLALSDEKGKTRAGLGLGKDGVGLELLDENGEQRAVLEATKARTGLELYNAKGKTIWSTP